MLNFDFIEKGLGIVSLPRFVYDFSKNVSRGIFYLQTKLNYLIPFTSWDNGQHMYYNFIFPRLFVINF